MKIFNLLLCTFILVVSSESQAEMTKQEEVIIKTGEAGFYKGNEADSRGPYSFAVKDSGEILLLDQENLRVLEYDAQGKLLGIIPIQSATFDDIAVTDQFLFVIDRLAAGVIHKIDYSGRLIDEIQLTGRGIERAGSVTAMYEGGGAIWCEVSHSYSVKVIDSDGNSEVKREIIYGRYGTEIISIRARINHKSVIVSIGNHTDKRPIFQTEIFPENSLRRIVHLEYSGDRIYIVYSEALFSPGNPYKWSEQYTGVIFDTELNELSRFYPENALTIFDQRGEIRVGPDGNIYQMFFKDTYLFVSQIEGGVR